MLTPEYLDVCADDLANMYAELDSSIIRLIAERIVKTNYVNDSSRWEAEILQQSGMLYDEIIAEIARQTGKSEKELEQLFKEAGIKAIEADNEIFTLAGMETTDIKQSAAMTQILKAGLKKTGGLLKNLTLTTAISTQTAYINAASLAHNQITTGALSYQEAVRQAVRSAARAGTTVLYPSGHIDQLDVAVRRAALTGVNQTTAEISLQNTADMGCNLVEVTAHAGARPSHAEWQGKIFMINGSSREYGNLAEVTGYGSGDGLCGWNCRHNFYPFFDGIDVRAYKSSDLEALKNDGVYELEQQQRSYERQIRATRRELAGYDSAMKAADSDEQRAAIKQDFDRASVKLKRQEAKLKQHCKDNNLYYDSNRVQTYYGKGTTQGFGHSTSQKAVWANRKEKIE